MTNQQKAIEKLGPIFSADVKGYGILMANGEVSTIQALHEYRLSCQLVLKSMMVEHWMLWVTTYWRSLAVRWIPFSVP